jgi:hypothetical protein
MLIAFDARRGDAPAELAPRVARETIDAMVTVS